MGFIYFFIFLVFQSAIFAQSDDPVIAARKLTQDLGMKGARDQIAELLRARDQSSGEGESRLRQAVTQLDAPADSIATLDQAARSRVMFAFVNGLAQGPKSRPTLFMKAAIQELRRTGYQANYLSIDPHGSEFSNGKEIAAALSGFAKNYDHLILVAGPKGTRDVIRALVDHRDQLTDFVIDRLRVVISFSGIIRESIPARWFLESKGLYAKFMRFMVFLPLIGSLKGRSNLRSIAWDPWKGFIDRDLRVVRTPTWINFVAIPDGKDGSPEIGFWMKRAEKAMQREGYLFGPHDGLIETAGQILPPESQITQWILPVMGDHNFLRGQLLTGETLIPPHQSWEDVETYVGRGGAIMARQLTKMIPLRMLQMPTVSGCAADLGGLASRGAGN